MVSKKLKESMKKFATNIKEKAGKGLKDLDKSLDKKITSKQVLRNSKTTITVREQKPAEYVPIYFQAELNKAKEDMGFWK